MTIVRKRGIEYPSKTKQLTFVNLKGKVFAEYKIIYHINDGYSVNQLSKFHSKNQLLFQKFSSTNQQLNLMTIEGYLPIILADVALEVFVKEVTSFSQYIGSNNKINVIDCSVEERYFKYKFYTFIHYLLYSNIASKKVCTGDTFTDKVFCIKNITGEIDFYSIYEQNNLQLMLLDMMKLEIDKASSSISKNRVTLCLKISVE